jgi:hypothetical protein
MLHKHIEINGHRIVVVDLETIMRHNAKADNFRHIGGDYYIVKHTLNMDDYADIAGFTIDTSLPQYWFDEHRYDRENYVWCYPKGNAFGEPMLKEYIFQVVCAKVLAHIAKLLQEENKTKDN